MFSDSRCKNACKMLADLCPCFHQSPTRPNFACSRVKVGPILCRLRTKLCPNFGCSRARLCPISFAPCPFPNLAGTLNTVFLLALLRPQNRRCNVRQIFNRRRFSFPRRWSEMFRLNRKHSGICNCKTKLYSSTLGVRQRHCASTMRL